MKIDTSFGGYPAVEHEMLVWKPGLVGRGCFLGFVVLLSYLSFLAAFLGRSELPAELQPPFGWRIGPDAGATSAQGTRTRDPLQGVPAGGKLVLSADCGGTTTRQGAPDPSDLASIPSEKCPRIERAFQPCSSDLLEKSYSHRTVVRSVFLYLNILGSGPKNTPNPCFLAHA